MIGASIRRETVARLTQLRYRRHGLTAGEAARSSPSAPSRDTIAGMWAYIVAHWSYVTLGILIYACCLYLYRIYFSPLSHIPGPKIAAATLFYEFYFDVVKDGRFPWKIAQLHQLYGPVVRINPREVHINDPDFVEQLFTQRLDKDPWFSQSFGVPLAGFATPDHNIHRMRRGAINKFFSKASIASRANVIEEKVLKLCSKLSTCAGTDEVVQLDAGFICMTLDAIAEFCYGVDYGYLDVPGFDKDIKHMLESAFAAGAVNRQFPIILTIAQALPIWLAIRLLPQVAGILRLQELIRVEARRILSSQQVEKTSQDREVTEVEHYYDTESAGISYKSTIFDQIIDSKLPPMEKSEERLVQEGQTFISAGSETTARVLYLTTVHLLEQPSLLAKLKRELQEVMPASTSQPSMQQLEQLPFLTAVIKEGIRLGGSTITRTARYSADQPIQYKDWTFPPRTPVSITVFHVLTDETLFPEPLKFNPMRWLTSSIGETGEEVLKMNTEMDKYFVAFSRGPRSCAGMWVAWAEVYLALAHVHRKLDMELYETSVEDVAAARDRFSAWAKAGSKGVRVKITKASD